MNKKILSFISLFCLTLVLSVYYVIVPYNGAIKDESGNDVEVNVTIEDGEELYFESLAVEKMENYQNQVESLESIVASSDYSNEEKETALNEIEEVVKKIKLEEQIESTLNSIGYKSVYIIIKNNVVHVVAKVAEPSPLDAATIIKNVFSLVSPGAYGVEVSFK